MLNEAPSHAAISFNIQHLAFNIPVESPPMKKFVVVLLLLFACEKWEPGGAKPGSTAGAPPAMKVGLLTPGSVNDNGWNAIAYEGLQRIHRELGAEISHQETRTPAEIEEGFRAYGSQGYDLVFGHGFEFQDPARKMGAKFPKTVYVTTSGNTVSTNVAP